MLCASLQLILRRNDLIDAAPKNLINQAGLNLLMVMWLTL